MKVIKMKKSDASEQAELTEKIRKASDAYYEGAPIMENLEFDRLRDELAVLERKSGFAYDSSPNIRIGAEVLPEKRKVRHEYPMFPLDKIKFIEGEKLHAFLGDREGVLTLKLDGMIVAATYEDGRLVRAATRGDGQIGQDVTHNAICFEGLPAVIPYKKKLIVQGEAVMPFTEFERINEKIRERNARMLLEADDPDDVSGDLLEPYANARDLACATVQLLDSRRSRRRRIEFYAYGVVYPFPAAGKKSNDLLALYEWLEKQGFNKEHIAGIYDYHSIRAGMPICTATDAASIFNALLESSGSFQILNLNLSPIHSCVHRLTKVSSESVITLLIRSSG